MRWPKGVESAGGSCGIKGGDLPDLGIVVADRPCAWAGTFTHNAAAAAPVRWSRSLLGREVRAIVVNSGNANACTGPAGDATAERTARRAGEVLTCESEQVLVASTGVIGVPLPVELIEAALPSIAGTLGADPDGFARSILTTDTCTKTSESSSGGATFVGVAKGAAMLAPNMATMLAFLATDAKIDPNALQACLARAVEVSFNRISVDACESTNDSVFVLSTGHGPALTDEQVLQGLSHVCCDLAHQMVRDAEGGSKVVRIRVVGGKDERHALGQAHAVAASALWRAAVHGADPNWGRIAAALGEHDRDLDLSRIEIAIGSETLFERGRPVGSLEAAKEVMETTGFDVTCNLGSGAGTAEVLTCDLSTQYVVENAFGTT